MSKNAKELGGFVKNQKRLSICCGFVEMKVHLWFRITSIVVFLQIALGGLLTFSSIPSLPHIITGFAVLAFANSHSGCGSDSETALSAVAGSLRRIGLVDHSADYPRIHHSEHWQSGDRMGPSAGCYGHLRDGDCWNLHVNETGLPR